MDLWQGAKDYGGHVLGFLALAQVWVIALWNRFLHQGTLGVYETANIEIGFSTFGPTVSLLGTLRALNKDIFVRRMKVRVIRTSDKAQHTFTWRAFRPSAVMLGAGSAQSLEIAGSFLVTIAAPRQYNVFFASAAFAAQYEHHVQPLRDAWQLFVEEQIRRVDEQLVGQIARALENPALSAAMFDQFIRAGNATNLHAAISNGFFWHSGDYQLEFIIETDGRPDTVTRRWRLSLSADEEQRLRLNVITLIRELCYLPIVYNFSYKEYSST